VTCSLTHTEGIVAFPLQQWLSERITVLLYTCIGYLIKICISYVVSLLWNIFLWSSPERNLNFSQQTFIIGYNFFSDFLFRLRNLVKLVRVDTFFQVFSNKITLFNPYSSCPLVWPRCLSIYTSHIAQLLANSLSYSELKYSRTIWAFRLPQRCKCLHSSGMLYGVAGSYLQTFRKDLSVPSLGVK